jgi:hypothetical protein
VLSTAPRHAHLAGFDLHANVAVPAVDRTRLEQLCRYLLRPAVAQDRRRLLEDGRVVLTLKTAGADGTRHLIFEPLTPLEKLAALTPWPRVNLVLYHGVLAANAGWRARVVAYGALAVEAPVPAGASADANGEPRRPPGSRHYGWASADEARVRSRRAGLPALRRAFAPARHGRRPGRNSGDPGRRRGFG